MTTPRFDRINGTWLALGALATLGVGAASMTRRGARNTDDPRIELAALEQAGVIMVGGGSVIDAAGVIVIGRWKAFGGKSVRDDPNGFRAEVAEVARSLQGMAGVEWLDRQIGETQAAVDAYGAAGEWGWGQAGSAAPGVGAASMTRRGARNTDDLRIELAALEQAGVIMVGGGSVIDAAGVIVIGRWKAFGGKSVRDDPNGFRAEVAEVARSLQGMAGVEWLDRQIGETQAAVGYPAQTYPDYPFYVVHSSGKVVSGWDYREDANEALAQDREVGFTGLKVFTTSGVKRKYGAIVWDQSPRLAPGSTNNDEPELLLPTLRPPPPRRDLPVLRQRAELALPDAELARRMLAGDDVLGELTFEQAAVYDPRRVDALISQEIGNAFAQVFGGRPGPMGDELYLAGVKFARQAHGGALPTAALVSLVQENLDRALFGAWPRLPGPVKAHLRRNLHIFDAGFDGAAQVARQAARVTRGTPDNIEWLRLAEYLEGHKPMLRTALTEALPGPAGGRRRLGPGRRMLPGPRDRDEW